MADDETTTAAEPGHDGSTDERLTRVENGIERLTSLVQKALGGGQREEPAAESPSGRPASIEEQVQAELDRRDRDAKAKAEQEAEKSEREQLKEAVRQLREKPPEPPVRRSTKLLGW